MWAEYGTFRLSRTVWLLGSFLAQLKLLGIVFPLCERHKRVHESTVPEKNGALFP